MKTVTEHIREHLLKTLGVLSHPPLESLQVSEWSETFEKLMRNRLIMGSFRYETFEEKRASPGKYDYALAAKNRLSQYVVTGNLEHLVDAANMCLLEFEFGTDDKRHFESIDDGKHEEVL